LTPAAPGLYGGIFTPNPFNPYTVIPYYLPQATRVTITVYDVAGRHVRSIRADVFESAGWNRATWDGRDSRGQAVASGVYFYRISAGVHLKTGKLAVVR
jgi:flagellar hook assembly protein FlgD